MIIQSREQDGDYFVALEQRRQGPVQSWRTSSTRWVIVGDFILANIDAQIGDWHAVSVGNCNVHPDIINSLG